MALVCDLAASLPSYGNFQYVCSVKSCNLIPVHKYQSRVTGLTVLTAEVEGPVVNGYFCLATEAHDDDGLPHTLEHLIFLGSKRYPYKSVLELFANRCLASGTNAWTDTDHTCYTLTSASKEGFLSLLPIYLDHILYPTLPDSGFITEVHHITGDGADGGVIYSEMQTREDLAEPITHLALLRAIYPEKCGYTYEAGGILKNLRESTNNGKVRDYHKQFYRPENLTLIITGQVKPEEILKSLDIVEETIVLKGDRGEFCHPWQDPIPPLEQSQDIEVIYPSEEEDYGMVYVGWRGPSVVTDLYKMQSCSILVKYLTDAAIGPLLKEFTAEEDRYASNVTYSLCENKESLLYLFFEKVPVDKLEMIKPRLEDMLKKIEHIDMAQLHWVIHRHVLEMLSQLEACPHETLASFLILDSIYGRSTESLNKHLNGVSSLEVMENEPESFWLDLLQHYLVTAPRVTVRGKPSREKQKAMAMDELKRIEEQRARIGDIGLKELAIELMRAIEKNEKQPPADMLATVPIQTTDSIAFHSVRTYAPTAKEQHPKFDLTHVPITMHLNNVTTNFVYVNVLLDTSGVGLDRRAYLPLFLESFLELPVRRGDVLVDHEDVIAELAVETLCAGALIGLETSDRFSCGPYAQTASLILQLELSNYERGISRIRELLFQTVFTVERLRLVASKMIDEVAEVKVKGHRVVGELMKGLCFSKESNLHVSSMFRQEKFLTSLIDKIATEEGAKQVLSEMEELRIALTDPNRIAIHLAVDVDRLAEMYENPSGIWSQLLPPGKTSTKRQLAVIPDWAMLNPASNDTVTSCIVGLEGEEATFFSQTCPSIRNFNDPDLAPLLVFLQYLTQLEGPMWRQILGNGLACLYQIMPRPNEGLLHMGFYWATDCVAAYKLAKGIFEAHMTDDVKWDPTLLEWARRSLTFEVIQREKSVGDVVTQTMLSFFKDVGPDYKRELMRSLSKVVPADLVRVGRKYARPLFDPAQVKTAVVCSPGKTTEIAAALAEMNHKSVVFSSPEECFLLN